MIKKRLSKIWNDFWFRPGSAFALGLFRFLFFLHLFYTFFGGDFFHRTLPDTFWQPVGLFRLWESPPLGTQTVEWMYHTWLWALLLSAIGLFTRISLIISALFGFYLMGQAQCYGFPISFWSILMIPLIIMMFSPCYDTFSFDRAIGLRKRMGPSMTEHYTWPLRLIQVTFALVFFFSAGTKLIQSGLAWVTSDTVRYNFLLSYYLPEISEFARSFKLGPMLAEYPLICSILAGVALVIELCAPLTLLRSSFRYVFIGSLLLLQIGNEFLITWGFFGACAVYWAWLPYPWIEAQVKKIPHLREIV